MARISVAFLDPACLRDNLMTSASKVQEHLPADFAPVRVLALLVTTLLLGHSGFRALAALPPTAAPGAAAHSCRPEFSYDGFDRRVSESYDAAGIPATEASAGVSPTDAYDAPGNRRFTCDNRAPRSRHAALRLQTTCDARHRTITIAGNYRSAQTLGHFTNSHYDPGENVRKSAGPDGVTSNADCDGMGRTDYSVAPGATPRPSPRQSEFDVEGLNPGHRPQVSFNNGREFPYGSRGSVRPDAYRVGEVLEVKNYNLLEASNRANLYNTVHRQYLQRISNLPNVRWYPISGHGIAKLSYGGGALGRGSGIRRESQGRKRHGGQFCRAFSYNALESL